MNNITISIQDLGAFVLFCLAITVGIFLIVTLSNFNKTIKRLNLFMDSNRGSVKEIFTLLPSTIKSVDEAAANIRDNVDKIGNVVDTVEDAVKETAVAVNDKTQGLLDAVNTISNVIKIILNAFTPSKARN